MKKHALILREEFFDAVHFARNLAAKTAPRSVKAEILYHMPDHPHLLQTFLYADSADRFTVAESILSDIERIERDAKRLIRPGEEGPDPAQRMFQLLVRLQDHVDRLEDTPEEFEIPFRTIPASQRLAVIRDVPFTGLRRLLTHWQKNLDGPLNTVRVTQCRAPRFGL
jgi:uncharacterized protein Usg